MLQPQSVIAYGDVGAHGVTITAPEIKDTALPARAGSQETPRSPGGDLAADPCSARLRTLFRFAVMFSTGRSLRVGANGPSAEHGRGRVHQHAAAHEEAGQEERGGREGVTRAAVE